MNQELMTLDFWQDTVIYEGKIFPIGTLACDALNVPADTLARMNEQCEKINLLLGMLNAGQDASALFPMAKEAVLTMVDILSETPPFSNMNIPKHRERIEKVFTADNALKYSDGDLSVVMDKNGCVTFSNTAHNLNYVTVGRLFDRFYTVEASRNSTGLGLSIAKLLIERMGGSIGAIYNNDKLQIKIIFAK